jgi:hypothetical protein
MDTYQFKIIYVGERMTPSDRDRYEAVLDKYGMEGFYIVKIENGYVFMQSFTRL